MSTAIATLILAAVQAACFQYQEAGMSAADREALSTEFRRENVRLALEARLAAPWGDLVPEEVFLDAVLPYANLDEPRDPWRAEFRERFRPLVAECRTPGEAALVLNREVFPALGVKYSTGRRRANQSPRESIEQGLASCTGLSIILVDACRACGVPARVAGVANWRKKNGNHTWVEIWDGGWHHTGAAEPSDRLDDVWFAADVAHAVPGSADHGVWAASWGPTGHHFPLVWAPEDRSVSAVETTERYRPQDAAAPEGVRLLVRVRDGMGKRVAAAVVARRVGSTEIREGRSRDESADTNDILPLAMPREGSWRIEASLADRRAVRTWRAGEAEQETLELVLPAAPAILPGKVNVRLSEWFEKAFAAIAKGEKLPAEPDSLAAVLRTAEGDAAARLIAWEAYAASPLAAPLRADQAEHRVVSGAHTSPFTLKDVGTRPAGGWPLVIAMHGGGGVPKEFNDSQWRHMQIYYRDHPEVTGYRYLALRAPNDTWNGFYDDYVYPLIERLVAQQILCADVDPDRVHLIGYSHGGYGCFAIAPKVPFRFAAAHASASAPTDGQTSARPLRNLPFTFMVGEKDTAYGRADRCRKFEEILAGLRAAERDGWPSAFHFIAGNGHTGLPDRDYLPAMLGHRRDPVPRRLDWELTDETVRRHYWIATDTPKRGARASVTRDGNLIVVEAEGFQDLRAELDARTIDFTWRFGVQRGEKVIELKPQPSLAVLARTLAERGDPRLAATTVVRLL
ncbi:MAG: transglutaminase domain-containing protein [Planctomycetota bacterium]